MLKAIVLWTNTLTFLFVVIMFNAPVVSSEWRLHREAQDNQYLSSIQEELGKKWPNNRTVRFVFHGHSVPAGYFRTPTIRRFDSYPKLFHERMCKHFSTAAIDVCITAIGGENSAAGAKRFKRDVLDLNPDVVFIDYGLNDRNLGLKQAETSWVKMINACDQAGIKVILLTPTPDANEKTLSNDTPLAKHAAQIRTIGEENGIPVCDAFARFQELVRSGNDVNSYLAQSNHPNRAGHLVVTSLLADFFIPGK